MPRLVKIPNCTHEVFAKIRGAFLDHAPWAIRNDIYESETKTAFFMFEDSDYIPYLLHSFIVSPPFDRGRLSTALGHVDEELTLIKQSLGLDEVGLLDLDTVTTISHSDLIDLLTEDSDKQFKESLEKLPPKIREKLLKWRSQKKESKK